jgi:hypothetical protein
MHRSPSLDRRASHDRYRRGGREESGIALVTAVLLLLLVAATAISSIDFSGRELQAGGRARATMRTLYAADAGIQFALQQVQPPTDLSAFDLDVGGIEVQSRERDVVGEQDIDEAGVGEPPEGYAINIGSGFINELYDINVTAVGANGSTAELEAKVGALRPNH